MTSVLGVKRSASASIGGSDVIFETGQIAKQADGAVVVRRGDTVVLATAQGRLEGRDVDFFPLTVDVEEKMYAAGKIPGGFFKREGRAGEKAILNARMIDRPIRPLWPNGYKSEVHLIVTVISTDRIHAHDTLAINGASAALMISSLPFQGPVGAVRIGLDDSDNFIIEPTLPQLLESRLDLLVVGTRDAIAMVEAGADEIPEDILLTALELAHTEIRGLCDAQEELRSQVGRPKHIDLDTVEEVRGRSASDIRDRIEADGPDGLDDLLHSAEADLCPPITMTSTEEDVVRRQQVRAALATVADEQRLEAVEERVRAQFESDVQALTDAEQDSKELKQAKRNVLRSQVIDRIDLPWVSRNDGGSPDAATQQLIKRAIDAVYKALVRQKIAVDKRRPDGRGAEEIRAIECDVAVTPRTHGSALFTRGQTQIMSLLTLGTAKEAQRIDDLSLEEERRYIHHYNFPPFSVGETGFMRGPKRRDIGHGALAQRALDPVIPDAEDFPYTIRVVSETLESNGSSSMGSVCGSTLALLDAGVNIRRPVAGIAMGLIKEGDDYVILTDIQGAEDHLGDMDFKVAGTSEGITALQMDIKITGVTREIMSDALEQARRARNSILETMAQTLAEAREELPDHAPRITSVQIDPEQIGLIIGKGGETIRSIEGDYDVQVDIEEDGTVLIYAVEGTNADNAADFIRSLTKEPEQGDEFTGKVVRTTDFGAFVELKKGLDGLLHISNVGPGRIGHIEDVMERGDMVDVIVLEVDKDRGRIALKLLNKHEDGGLVSPEALMERVKAAGSGERNGGSEQGGQRREGGGGNRQRRRRSGGPRD